MRWIVKLNGGPRLVNHAAVVVGEKIFSFGGYCTGENYRDKLPIRVFVLNTRTYRWVEILPPEKMDRDDAYVSDWPYQRYGHTTVVCDQKVYMFGGRDDNSPCNKTHCFDTGTYQWTTPEVSGPLPPQLDGHSACIIGDAMYVFGGCEHSPVLFGVDVFKLDLSEEPFVWSHIMGRGDPPIHRDFHTATAIGNRMYLFGGRSGQGHDTYGVYPNDVYYLDTVTERWHKLPANSSSPCGRRSHSAINMKFNGKDCILVFGGYNINTNAYMNELWLFRSSDAVWTRVEPQNGGPCPRRRQTMCATLDGRVFVFGGTSPNTGPTIVYSPEQLYYVPELDRGLSELVDHNDLHVLDLWPSLETLTLLRVIEEKLSTDDLPEPIRQLCINMKRDNKISSPLRRRSLKNTG